MRVDRNLVEVVYWGEFFQVGAGMSIFLAGEGTPRPHTDRTNFGTIKAKYRH